MKKKCLHVFLCIVIFICSSLESNAKDSKKGVSLKSFNSHESVKKTNINKELSELQEENFMLRKQKEALKKEKIKLIGQKLKLEKKIAELNNKNIKLQKKNDDLYMEFFLIKENSEFNEENSRKFKKMTTLNNIKLLSRDKNTDSEKIRLKAVQFLRESEDAEGYYYFNLAKAYEEEKQYKKAIENYMLAIGVNSMYIPAYGNLGLIYTEIGNYENAVTIFEKYIELSDNQDEKEIIEEFIRKIRLLIEK